MVKTMSCQYGFYKPQETNKPKLYCKITNDLCVYSKLCLKPSVNKYIFNDKADNCMIKKDNEKKSIPNGSYPIRFILKGYAYVEIGDKVIKVNCSGLNGIDNYIYLQQNTDGTYIGSLTPFTTEINMEQKKPKRNNKKRKSRVETNYEQEVD